MVVKYLKYFLVLGVLATGLAGLAAGLAGVDAPASGYVTLDANGEPFKNAFNAAEGKVRVVAYVAPTCGGCLRGAKLLQDDVLGSVRDDRVEVLVVWVPKNGARERHVDRVIKLVTDDRATHYWDEHGYVVDALDERLGLTGRACAGAFLVYGPDVRWTGDAPPDPAYWSDAHSREFEQHGPDFDPEVLEREVRALLDK